MSHKLLIPLVALSATLAAQTPPCESRNDANTTVSTSLTASPFIGLNPSSRAYQFSPSSVIVPQSAAIFTGSPFRDDFMRLEIWDEDTTTTAPGTRLAVGTMSSPMSATANWLGTNFDVPPPPLVPGTTYWFVWIESGASIVPEEPGGVVLPRRTRASTNAWGSLGSGAAKIRLFCNLLDGAGVTNFGAPCATTANQLPTAFTNDAPTAGNAAFEIEGTNLRPGAMVLLVIGGDVNHISIPLTPFGFPAGCSQNTDYIVGVNGTAGTAEIGSQPSSPRPPAFGHVRFSLPLSGVGSGGYFSAQLFTVDTFAVPIPLPGTNGLRITTL